MRSMYRGTLGFGLVAIPIQLYKALSEESVEIHLVHRPCGTRIQYQKRCPYCDQTVEADDTARAAPLPDGRLVILPTKSSDEPKGVDRTVTILSFHSLSEIDPVYYYQAYWIKPGAGGLKAYALLADAMRSAGQVALANLTLRQRKRLAVIRPFKNHSLMLHSMHYPESLRTEREFDQEPPVSFSVKERELAHQLLAHMQEPFVPESFPNAERRALLDQIEELVPSARAPMASLEAATEVKNLMDQLKASMANRNRPHHDTGVS